MTSKTEKPGGDSSGRSSATFASSQPRALPPARESSEDPNAPAVIVAGDDGVASAPPLPVPLPPVSAPPSSRRGAAVAAQEAAPPSGHGRPSSGALATAPPSGQTLQLPERPQRARRERVATVVMRPRGPSRTQKVLAFGGMLFLVTACGVGILVWRQPSWFALDARSAPAAATAPTTEPSLGALASAATLPAAPPATAMAAPPATAMAAPPVTAAATAPLATAPATASAPVAKAVRISSSATPAGSAASSPPRPRLVAPPPSASPSPSPPPPPARL